MKGLRIVLFLVLTVLCSAAYAQKNESGGAQLYNNLCNRCHPNGSNIIMPDIPLRGSSKLADFKTFLSFMRDPKMPDGSEGVMPGFSKKQITDQEAKKLYQYITSVQSSGTLGSGYGMGRGMMGGYGMGPGMMGGGMMGHGMMGRYNQSDECQKFLDETAGLRKELNDKRFEYSEAYRNPKTSPETIVELERKIHDLQKKIFAKAPLGCSW